MSVPGEVGPSSKYVCLPSFVYWYSRHLCSINWGGPLAKEGSSAKYEHTSKLLLNNFWCYCLQEIHSHFGGPISQSRFICQVWCSSIQGIYSRFMGGPLAKVGSSAKFWCTGIQGISALSPRGVHLPKYVCLPSFVYQYSRHLCSINGGSISQSRLICQVGCTGIQGISALLPGGVHLPKYVGLPSFVYWYSRHLCSINWGVHWPKKVCLPNMNTLLNYS